MGNAEQATITNLAFNSTSVIATVQNTGNAAVEITQVYVTGPGVTGGVLVTGNTTIPKGTAASNVVVNIAGTTTVGNEYTVKFVTSKANSLSYAQVRP
jgi:hypothetical protein